MWKKNELIINKFINKGQIQFNSFIKELKNINIKNENIDNIYMKILEEKYVDNTIKNIKKIL